jgi:hypothetical protein
MHFRDVGNIEWAAGAVKLACAALLVLSPPEIGADIF